ncbi:hypothetical protein M9H77_35730 [Catharanthus roseus]|uniref:Uncharacterized protein n=1 Tax=Catharanthus roseus TaxID=4058 RepID=A0ACB9ZQK9_CATRO|nr:hypothetical protein M9H77_35730 [Catharanthus roseus]
MLISHPHLTAAPARRPSPPFLPFFFFFFFFFFFLFSSSSPVSIESSSIEEQKQAALELKLILLPRVEQVRQSNQNRESWSNQEYGITAILNGRIDGGFWIKYEPEEYVDHRHLFATDRILNMKSELVNWAKEAAMEVNVFDCHSRGGANKPRTKPIVDDEEEVQVKRRVPYGTKKCGCPFKLKGEQMAMCENWQSHVPSRNILQFFREQNVDCAVRAQKYITSLQIKKNRMQGRNTIKEVLCISIKRGYTVFYRNREDSNMLSDIVVAHQTSIEMMRTWPYVLIMDTTYKTNK